MQQILSEFKQDTGDKKSEPEKVNHPKHYNNLPATCSKCGHPIEAIDVVQHMNFNRGNTVKYIWRCGAKDKDAEILDLQKAIKYLEFEIKRLQKEMGNAS